MCVKDIRKILLSNGNEHPSEGTNRARLFRSWFYPLKYFLRDRGLKSLALFGPIIHGAARPDGDINVLVEVDLDAGFSVNDLPEVKNFLEDRLGRRVDVVTREGLDPAVRDRVLHEAEAVF